MTTVYLDESGFTGTDLLNAEQPYFVIASSVIGDEEAKDILGRSFPRYQGSEYKFSNIWKRNTHRSSLRTLASEVPALENRLYLWIIDKRFCVMTKMLDYLIEPMVYDAGGDFYVGGYAQRFMNTAYMLMQTAGLYEASITKWDAFARAPAAATMDELRRFLADAADEADGFLAEIFRMALAGTAAFGRINDPLEDFVDTNEVQLSSVFSTVIWWRQQRPEDLHLAHDESGAFLRQQATWSTMLRDDFVSPPMPQGNGTLVEFPLRVRTTTAASSHDSHAIQLCDVIAGLGAKAAPGLLGGEGDPFVSELIEAGAGELGYGGVKPYPSFIQGPPPPRTGPDMVDRMRDLLAPDLERRIRERMDRD